MLHVEADADMVQMNFETPEAMQAYVQDKINQSVVNPGDIPAAADINKTFALFTCDNISIDGRYILYAYIDEASAEGLTGNLGLQKSNGQTTGFANDLMMDESAEAKSQESPQEEAEEESQEEAEDEA